MAERNEHVLCSLGSIKLSELRGKPRRKAKILFRVWYVPCQSSNGYSSKVIRKLNYCTPFIHFVRDIMNLQLEQFTSLPELIKYIVSKGQGCEFKGQRFDNNNFRISNCCYGIEEIGINLDSVSPQGRNIVSDELKTLMSKPIINIIFDYCGSYVMYLCDRHSNTYLSWNNYLSITYFNSNGKWAVRTKYNSDVLESL